MFIGIVQSASIVNTAAEPFAIAALLLQSLRSLRLASPLFCLPMHVTINMTCISPSVCQTINGRNEYTRRHGEWADVRARQAPEHGKLNGTMDIIGVLEQLISIFYIEHLYIIHTSPLRLSDL